MEYEVCCEHPLWIRNPKFFDAIMCFDWLYYNGVPHQITPSKRSSVYYGYSMYAVFGLKYQKDPSVSFRSGSYFLRDDGVMLPFFIQVSCGKCAACRSKYHSSLIQRATFAYEESDTDVLYVTLTYNNDHLPKDGLVSLSDVQRFKKRLNKFVSSISPDTRLKYFCFAEYGDGGRPHYHMLIYNFPNYRLLDANEKMFKTQILQYCWRESERVGRHYLSFGAYHDRNYKVYDAVPGKPGYDVRSFGFVNMEVVDDEKVSAYVSKYVSKHADDKTLFKSISHYLGIQFVKDRFLFAYNSIDRQFEYLSRSGGIKRTGLTSYYIKNLIPSSSVKFPVQVRRSIHNLHFECQSLFNNKYTPKTRLHHVQDISNEVDSIFPFFETKPFDTNYLYNPYHKDYEEIPKTTQTSSKRIIDSALAVINAYIVNPVDFAPDYSRDLYFQNLRCSPGAYACIKGNLYRKKMSKLRASAYL